MIRVELPTRSGAYRWYYADVTAGEVSAVAIFMVGSLFSARYAASLARGGLPGEHAAVNFALYERGVRTAWVLTEYPSVAVEEEGRALRIGGSTLRYDDGGFTMVVRERTTPWGGPLEARLRFEALAPLGPELRLVEGQSHHWRPICARGAASLAIATHGVKVSGRGYHDGNHGEAPLGSDLTGWQWTRTHGPARTEVHYQPWGGAPALTVHATRGGVQVSRGRAAPVPTSRTGWALPVPTTLGVAGRPTLLESSPFYARLEAHGGDTHAIAEVADFARFHLPAIRWMANLRTRYATGGAS